MFFNFFNKKARDKKTTDTATTQTPSDTAPVPEKDNAEPEYSKYHIFEKLEKGIPLPEKLIDLLPDPDMIIITAYGDEKASNGKRLHIALGKSSSDEKFIQYQIKPASHNSFDSVSDEVFGCSFHPFIRKFTDNVTACSKTMLRSIQFAPSIFEISQNALFVLFNGGYYHTKYEENEDHIEYSESYQDSYHDGGGSGSLEWSICAADKKEEGQDLLHDKKVNEIELPSCKGYWFENDRLYLVDPWGLSGVFEYYHDKNERYDYESENQCYTIGVKPEP